MAPPSLPYGTHLNDAMDIIKPSLKNYEELPISTNGLYELVLTIGKYQDTLYDWYAPNYNSDENRIKYLLDMDDTESEIDINRAYKKISTILSILQLVIKVDPPKKVKKSEYDDYFELLLIIHNNLYTNRLSPYEITVVSKQDAKIGEVMHDAWALNTYFTNNSQFEYNYENATENGTRKDRVEQFKYFKELNRLEQLKDYVSYCCVIYAMSQTENIDQIIQDIAPKTGGKKMLKTTERVNLPLPGKGKSKRSSVVYVCGKTKYVRKGGEWETLTKALKQKKVKNGGENWIEPDKNVENCSAEQNRKARVHCMTKRETIGQNQTEPCMFEYCKNAKY